MMYSVNGESKADPQKEKPEPIHRIILTDIYTPSSPRSIVLLSGIIDNPAIHYPSHNGLAFPGNIDRTTTISDVSNLSHIRMKIGENGPRLVPIHCNPYGSVLQDQASVF